MNQNIDQNALLAAQRLHRKRGLPGVEIEILRLEKKVFMNSYELAKLRCLRELVLALALGDVENG